MNHRAMLVLVIVAAMASVQLVASFATGPRASATSARVGSPSTSQTSRLTTGVALADNASNSDNSSSSDNSGSDNSSSSDNSGSDNSGSDNSSSSDNSGSDNSGSDNSSSSDNSGSDNSSSSDNSGSDNSSSSDNSSDNSSSSSSSGDNSADASSGSDNPDEIIDNVSPADAAPTSAPATSRVDTAPSPAASPATVAAAPSPAAVTDVSATATGIDSTLALPGNRVVVMIPASLQSGTVLKLRMLDPLSQPPTAGIRAGDLIFQLDATDASGAALTTLPSEVTIKVTYADRDVFGLNKANITLGHLDPSSSMWSPAPKQVADAASNSIAATVTATGPYAVYVQ